MTRRLERTTDPEKLARHLSGGIGEIADYAAGVARNTDPKRMRTVLVALEHQLGNAAAQVREAIEAIDEAREFGGLPEWDVVAEGNPAASPVSPPR